MFDPAHWYEWIKVAAFAFGLAFGGLAIGSPAWVWLRKQLLTGTAGLLAILGTVLISMSIWQSVEIETAGLKLRITELSEALELQLASVDQEPGSPERQAKAIASAIEMIEAIGRVREGRGTISVAEPGTVYTEMKDVPGLEQAYKDYIDKSKELEVSAEALKRRAEKSDIFKHLLQGPAPLGGVLGSGLLSGESYPER